MSVRRWFRERLTRRGRVDALLRWYAEQDALDLPPPLRWEQCQRCDELFATSSDDVTCGCKRPVFKTCIDCGSMHESLSQRCWDCRTYDVDCACGITFRAWRGRPMSECSSCTHMRMSPRRICFDAECSTERSCSARLRPCPNHDEYECICEVCGYRFDGWRGATRCEECKHERRVCPCGRAFRAPYNGLRTHCPRCPQTAECDTCHQPTKVLAWWTRLVRCRACRGKHGDDPWESCGGCFVFFARRGKRHGICANCEDFWAHCENGDHAYVIRDNQGYAYRNCLQHLPPRKCHTCGTWFTISDSYQRRKCQPCVAKHVPRWRGLGTSPQQQERREAEKRARSEHRALKRRARREREKRRAEREREKLERAQRRSERKLNANTKQREAYERRRQRIIDATTSVPVTNAQLALIRSAPCVYCGSPGAHADHIRPLYRGGHHRLENLVSACKACNSFKATLLLVELEKVRPDLVMHALLVSPLVMAAYAREKLGGTLNGPVLEPITSTLTSDQPARRYGYTEPATADLTAAWQQFHGMSA